MTNITTGVFRGLAFFVILLVRAMQGKGMG
jgi:hypothetical protein